MYNLFRWMQRHGLTGWPQTVLGLAIALVCGALVYGAAMNGRDMRESELYAALRSELASAMRAIDGWRQELARGIEHASRAPALRSANPAQIEEELRYVHRSYPIFLTVGYADASGLLVGQSSAQREGPFSLYEALGAEEAPISLAGEQWFRAALRGTTAVAMTVAQEDIVRGGIQEDMERHSGLLLFAAPVDGGSGQAAGVVFGTVDISALDRAASGWQWSAGGEMMLVDKTGRRIAPQPFSRDRSQGTDSAPIGAQAGQPLRQSPDQGSAILYARAAASAEDIGSYRNSSGEAVIGAYVWSSDREWLLTGEIGSKPLFRSYHLQVGATLIAVGLALSAGWAGGVLFSRRTNRMLGLLLDGTRRLREGRFGYRIDPAVVRSASAEWQELTEQFNTMSGQLRMTVQQLEQSAVTDELTGVYNRRFLMHEGARLEEAAALSGRPGCLLLVDIDYFKQVNDRYGHQTGDRVLGHAASLLTASVRHTDVVSRYGGEEFALLVFDCGLERGQALAERIRLCFAEWPYREGELTIPLTVSIGVAPLLPRSISRSEALAEWIGRADKALYRAKHQGRNRVECDVLEAE